MSEQQVAYEQETNWLRWHMEHTGGNVFFPAEVDDELRAAGRSRPEVLQVLRDGVVTYSEKADFGWQWFVDALDCDGKPARIVLEAETNTERIEVRQVLWD